MSLQINTLTIDARDPARLAAFWVEALDWKIIHQDERQTLIAPVLDRAEEPGAIAVLFQQSTDAKVGKNRWHFDLVPDDQAAEVARLESLGARRVDIGQGEVDWIVLADPEGNELCVLRSFAGPARN
jgi:predicted enzyme related to lactoylglutathione lyase